MTTILCVSLTERTAKKCLEFVSSSKADILEHRLDFMDQIESLEEIYRSSRKPIIAACRTIKNGGQFVGTEDERIGHLLEAIKLGASYVDVELGTDQAHLTLIKDEAQSNDCKVILSKHYHENTPDNATLEELLDELSNVGADIMKVVSTPLTKDDCLRILQLYTHKVRQNVPLISFAMGALGRFTRVAALFLGAPFMYVSQDHGDAAALGQIPISKMRAILEALQ